MNSSPLETACRVCVIAVACHGLVLLVLLAFLDLNTKFSSSPLTRDPSKNKTPGAVRGCTWCLVHAKDALCHLVVAMSGWEGASRWGP